MRYWQLVEPIWDVISIYDGSEAFEAQYRASPEASRTLFAAHWCQSEVRNGGFEQFFSNSTGVLAPEAVEAFKVIGMPKTARVVETAMTVFGSRYPRDRGEREAIMESAFTSCDDESYPFEEFDEEFFDLIKQEGGGFEASADRYAERNA